jgi:hypothetical protein
MTVNDLPTGLTADLVDSSATTLTAAALTAADTSVSSNLTLLASVHQARLARLNRTLANLTSQSNPDPSVIAATKAAISAQQTTLAQVKLLKTQSAAQAPAVAANGWAVWGHVYDANSAPLSNYTVFLVDANKAYQSAYGFSYTDANGAFSIVYAEPATLEGQQAGGSGAPSVPSVYLAIANDKAEEVYLGSSALLLSFGEALYVDTTLPSGEPALGDLPQQIRKTALPPSAKS